MKDQVKKSRMCRRGKYWVYISERSGFWLGDLKLMMDGRLDGDIYQPSAQSAN